MGLKQNANEEGSLKKNACINLKRVMLAIEFSFIIFTIPEIKKP